MQVLSFDVATFELGLGQLEAAPDEQIRIYNPARTVVDLMRLRRQIGENIALTVLHRYLRTRGAEPATLLRVRSSTGRLRSGAGRRRCGLREMSRPQRSTPAGRAYLGLQRLSRHTGRSMQALLPMFASERWLARLAASPHRSRFVLKGGVLLAALGNRRPTQDADLLALNIANDHDTVIGYVNEIAVEDLSDGMAFDPATTTATTIRESDLYLGVRLSMDCALATARIRAQTRHQLR